MSGHPGSRLGQTASKYGWNEIRYIVECVQKQHVNRVVHLAAEPRAYVLQVVTHGAGDEYIESRGERES